MFGEDDLLPISALQHLLFCERQCTLIHVEQVWAENRLTVEGRHLHERVDDGQGETRAGLRVARALPLRSFRLGLSGRADVVQFHAASGAEATRVVPVEYKRGRPKADDSDRVQLCAQALCLEEMLGVAVPAGALYYGALRRRVEVAFEPDLRGVVERTAARLHAITGAGVTPVVARQPKCDSCSLVEICMPGATGGRRSARAWMDRALSESLDGPSGGELA